jgi:NADPH-dependent 2,4-dienoyl-CoA reductase/sulfur reductase-like enzyme
VAGAGYIAVELAGVLQELGSDVTLLIRRDKVIGISFVIFVLFFVNSCNYSARRL